MDESKMQNNGVKMIKPPQVGHNNWVLLKDQKSKDSKYVPLLSKSQIKKIQMKYSACQRRIVLKANNQILKSKIVKPNSRFNRERTEEDRKVQPFQEFEKEMKEKRKNCTGRFI